MLLHVLLHGDNVLNFEHISEISFLIKVVDVKRKATYRSKKISQFLSSDIKNEIGLRHNDMHMYCAVLHG